MMYGHRARIGYTVAAVTTEVFPIDWNKIVPDGVTLMMITLPLGDRSPDDVKKCFDISIDANMTVMFTFDKVGTFAYHCGIHPQMKGVIQVCDGSCG